MFGAPSFSAGTFGQPQQQSTGMFGAPSTQSTFTGFGQPQQQTGSVFGQTTAFGQPQQQAAGSGLLATSSFGTLGQQQQPASGIFSSFGQSQPQQTTSTFPGFGQTQPQQSTGAFTGFGQTQPQQSTATFSGFGQTQPQPGTSTFSGFGQTQQQPTSTFTGFGQPQQSTGTFSGFGQTQPQQQQTAGAFSGFGQTQQPTTSTFSGFGQTQQQQTSTFTGFGQTQQPATSTFSGFGTGFGQQQPATAFSFSNPVTTTTTTGAFNFTGALGTSTNQPSTQIGVAQPFSFSTPKPITTAAPFSFSTPSLGQPQQTTSIFQPLQTQPLTQQQPTFSFQTQQQPFQFQQQLQPQQQQAATLPQQQAAESHAFFQSIFQCHKFGDERDAILASLNFLQAAWGVGKGHYSQTFPPITYTPENPMYRFKSISYAFIQTENNEDGHVTFDIKKPEEKVRQEESNLLTALQNMVGRPNIFFKVVGMKRTDANTTMINLFAEDRNTLRRIPATDLATGLLQPHLKGHLDGLMIENILPKIRPSPEQLKRYLENAPQGLDPRVWKQAQEDNPDPQHMIPVPIIGIEALRKRAAVQESESHQHMVRLELIEEDIGTLQNRHTNMTAELQQLKRKQFELAHRLLKIILRHEVRRKDGTAIQPEEEELNKLLSSLEQTINTPTEFRGRLNELLSRARLKQNEESAPRYSLDEETLTRIKTFLETQQESIQSIAGSVHEDIENLRVLTASLNEFAFETPDVRPCATTAPISSNVEP